jgi:hypothetical protein
VAVANGVVYFQSEDGTLYALDEATGEVLAQLNTGGVFSGPAVSNGRLYLGQGGLSDPGGIVALGVSGGLSAAYFNNPDLSGDPALTRIDPAVNFDWGNGSPDKTISPDHFSVRWTGFIQPPYDGFYTFYTVSDAGVRLWVNDELVIDNWTDHLPTEDHSEPILLLTGQTYSIRLEYHEDEGAATIQLLWSGPFTPETIIPPSQLYPM